MEKKNNVEAEKTKQVWKNSGYIDELTPMTDAQNALIELVVANPKQQITMPEGDSIVWGYSIVQWCRNDGEDIPHGVIIEIENGDRQYLTIDEYTVFLNNI